MSVETYSQLVTDVGNRIQKTDTAYKTKIKEFLNAAAKRWQTRFPWTELLRESTITPTAGSSLVVCPKDLDEIMTLYDPTNGIKMRSMNGTERLERYMDRTTVTGLVTGFSYLGEVGCAVQPASAGVLNVVSSDAADNSAFNILIQGVVGGERQYEEFTLNGTSAVTGSKSFSQVDRVSGLAGRTGVVTLKQGSTTLDTLGPQEDTIRRKRLKLVLAPAAATDFTAEGFQRFIPMSRDNDVPQIPVAEAMKEYAYGKCLQEQRQFSKAQIALQAADALVQEIFDKGAMRSDRIEQSIPIPYPRYDRERFSRND